MSATLAPFSPRQEEVLDVVERVFLREGIRAVRMGALADEAACSRSTLYEIAPSREDLLLLVLDRMMRRIARDGWAAVEAESDPVARVRVMLTGGALDASSLGPRFLEAISSHEPARQLFDGWIATGRDALMSLIDDAVRAGRFVPVRADVIAEAFLAVVLRFNDPVFPGSVSATDGLAELFDLLLDGLLPRG